MRGFISSPLLSSFTLIFFNGKILFFSHCNDTENKTTTKKNQSHATSKIENDNEIHHVHRARVHCTAHTWRTSERLKWCITMSMHNSIKSRHGYMDSIRFACVYDVVYRRTYIRPRCNPRAHARKHLQFRFVSKVLIVMANEFRVDFFLLLFAVCSQRLCGLSNCHDAHRTSTSVTINRGCALQNAWLASHTHTHNRSREILSVSLTMNCNRMTNFRKFRFFFFALFKWKLIFGVSLMLMRRSQRLVNTRNFVRDGRKSRPKQCISDRIREKKNG